MVIRYEREREKGALQNEYIRHKSDGLVWRSDMREKGHCNMNIINISDTRVTVWFGYQM